MKNHLWILALIACLGFVGCGGDSASSPAGTYVLDAESLAASLLEMGLAAVPEEMRDNEEVLAKAEAEAKMQSEAMQMSFTVEDGGTWTGTANMGGQETVAKGTWTQAGDTLTFITTEKDGKPETEEDAQKVTLKDGAMVFQPEDAPFEFRLVRK